MKLRIGSAGLSYAQVFVLMLGFTLASAVIFFFGFLVGQRRTEWLLAREERVVRREIPVQPTPEEGAADLAFYESMREKAYRRLQEGTAAPALTAAPRTAAPERPTATPVRMAAKSPAAPPPVPTQPQMPDHRRGRDEWADAGWTVQVNATTNPEQANEMARSLRAKGYDAYTVQAPLRGQTWYRVRVGRFANRDQAREMEARLKAREGMENAYVTAR
jgi:cell division septation protein DedD